MEFYMECAVMSVPGDDNLWLESPNDDSKSISDGEKDDVKDGEDEDEEDDVDSAVYEAELEQEIDEEEVQEEVDKLQEESERPIEELIAMYGLPQGSAAGGGATSTATQESAAPPSSTTSSGRRTRFASRRRAQDTEKGGPPASRRCLENLNNSTTAHANTEGGSSAVNGLESKQTSTGLRNSAVAIDETDKRDDEFYSKMFGNDAVEEDDENDEDFDPGIDEKKAVQVGEAYQANVPTDLFPYPENEKHKHDLSMIWDPTKLPQEQVEKYLHRVYCDDLGEQFSPAANHSRRKYNPVADDENLLYLLQRCDYNPEEAFLRRKCQNVDEKAFPDYMSLWTEEEVANFERGILHYGKNFHLIHAHKLCKRDVPQLVEFYYWWKKSARYEHFVRAFKLDRRAPSQYTTATSASVATSSQQVLEGGCADDEDAQVCVDESVAHVNGNSNATTDSGEYMESIDEEEEYISGNYEGVSSSIPSSQTTSDPSAAPESPSGTSDSEKVNVNAEQPAFKPWDPNREKFDYEMPRRIPCSVPRQKSPNKGSSRPKRASIMACL